MLTEAISNPTGDSSINCPLHGAAKMTPCDPEEIKPLVQHLVANMSVMEPMTFPRGTVLPDGRLDLCKQNLGPLGCAMVTEALRCNTTIKSLLLGTDGIGNSGAAQVARLIETNPHLEILYLGCNLIDAAGSETLADALRTNQSVTGLWLKRNPLGVAGTKAIADMLRHNRTIRTLDLVTTQMGPEGLAALLEVLLHHNRTVERLYLGGNEIGVESCHKIAAVMERNPVLKALLLNVNDLGDEGATILASALQQNRTLTELGLASNGMTQLGAAMLFTALAEHRALQKLDLGYSPSTKVLRAKPNFIGDEGAREVAQFLRRNTALQQLDLRRTGITRAGIEVLLAGLRENQTLTRFWLDGKQDVRIARILSVNQQLRPSTDLSLPSDVAKIRSVYRTLTYAIEPPSDR